MKSKVVKVDENAYRLTFEAGAPLHSTLVSLVLTSSEVNDLFSQVKKAAKEVSNG